MTLKMFSLTLLALSAGGCTNVCSHALYSKLAPMTENAGNIISAQRTGDDLLLTYMTQNVLWNGEIESGPERSGRFRLSHLAGLHQIDGVRIENPDTTLTTDLAISVLILDCQKNAIEVRDPIDKADIPLELVHDLGAVDARCLSYSRIRAEKVVIWRSAPNNAFIIESIEGEGLGWNKCNIENVTIRPWNGPLAWGLYIPAKVGDCVCFVASIPLILVGGVR